MFENKNHLINEIVGILDIIEYKTDASFLYAILERTLQKIPHHELEQFNHHLHHLETENATHITSCQNNLSQTVMHRLQNLVYHAHIEMDTLLDILEYYLSLLSMGEIKSILHTCHCHVNYYNISLSPI